MEVYFNSLVLIKALELIVLIGGELELVKVKEMIIKLTRELLEITGIFLILVRFLEDTLRLFQKYLFLMA